MSHERQLQLQRELLNLRRSLEAKLLEQTVKESTNSGSNKTASSQAQGSAPSWKPHIEDSVDGDIADTKDLDVSPRDEVCFKESLFLEHLQAKKLVNWFVGATKLLPAKATKTTTSILEAVCFAVKGKLEHSFCAHLLYSISALLRAGPVEGGAADDNHGVTLYDRWHSQDLRQNGGQPSRQDRAKKWQSIVSLEPMERLECEPVYLMAIAQILGVSIMVHHIPEVSASSRHGTLESVHGLYLPMGNRSAQRSKVLLTFAIMGKDCCFLKPLASSSETVVVPLVTCKASMIPLRLLLPSEQCHEILPQYLHLDTYDVYEATHNKRFPILCARSTSARSTTSRAELQVAMLYNEADKADRRNSGRNTGSPELELHERRRRRLEKLEHAQGMRGGAVVRRSRSFSPEKANTSAFSFSRRRHSRTSEVAQSAKEGMQQEQTAQGASSSPSSAVLQSYFKDLASRGLVRSRSDDQLITLDEDPPRFSKSVSMDDLTADTDSEDIDDDGKASGNSKAILRKRLSMARQVSLIHA